MRHKSRGGTVDASQSLYTKESFSHLFGINKKMGREYKVPPSYHAAVVEQSPTFTQTEPTKKPKLLHIARTTFELVGSTRVRRYVRRSKRIREYTASTSESSTDVDSEMEGIELASSTMTDSGITQPDVLILEPEPDIIDLTLSP